MTEFAIVSAIVFVLIAFAFSAFTDTIRKVRQKNVADAFLLAIMQAKSEAIKRNARVVICKSKDGYSCAFGGGWHQGWLIFRDDNNSGTREGAEERISIYLAMDPNFTISGNENVGNYVSFNSLGFSRMTNGKFQAGTFNICPLYGRVQEIHKVIINSLGRARIQSSAPFTGCGAA